MRFIKPLLALLVAAFGWSMPARADCPVVTFGVSGTIQPDNCGPIVYNGSAAATLTLPRAPWHGSIINIGSGTVTLVDAFAAKVNGASGGVAIAASSGATISGDPSAGWWAVIGGSGGGGGTPVVFVGASAGAANTYTIAAPTPSGYTLVNQYVIRTTISATNTGASTENVASTGALPIVINAANGLTALVGGELVAGLEYDLTYSTSSAAACGNSCYVATALPQSAVVPGTTQTVSASQWATFTAFAVTTASQTLTLPVSSALSPNGGVIIMTVGQSVTLAPNAADAINGGSAGSSVTIASGLSAIVVKSSAGNISVQPTTSGSGISLTPNYVAALWYAPFPPKQRPAGAAIPANQVSCFPGTVLQAVHIEALAAQVTTLSAGGNFQLAVYNSGSWGRPSTVLANTGSISTAATGGISGAVTQGGGSVSVPAGTYWFCFNQDNAVAAYNVVGDSSSADALAPLIGASTVGSFTDIAGINVSQTFGTWPTFVSGTAWTNATGAASIVYILFQVLSIP